MIAYALVALVVRNSKSGKERLDAGFEMFLGAFLLCLFGYPALRGLLEGVTWFGGRGTPLTAIARDASPTFYWILEGFAILISILGAFIVRSGIRKYRRAREAAL